MAISARELVFYIRAEDQASRVVKRAAKNLGSLQNLKGIQKQMVLQPRINQKAIDNATLAIRRNQEAIDGNTRSILDNQAAMQRAQAQLSRYSRLLNQSRGSKFGMAGGYTTAELTKLVSAQRTAMVALQQEQQRLLSSAATLTKQEEMLAAAQEDVIRSTEAATAALEQQLAVARVDRWEGIIRSVQGVARAVRLIGIGIGVSLAFAAHQAANFQTQLTLAASQARPVGAGAAQTTAIAGRLSNVVLQQMQKFPASSQDMADALYQIFSSTNIQNIKQASSELTLFNQAAVAGGTDLKTMADAGITLQNNFVGAGREFSNLNQAFQVFFSAVRYGRMNATQFGNSLSYVAGIAKEAGLSFQDIADAMATLTRQTGSARTNQDAQGLARLIQQFANPDFIAGAKTYGIQVIDPITNKLKPLLNIVEQLKAKADTKGIAALNLFKTITAAGSGNAGTKGTIQAQRALAYLLNNLEEYKKVSGDVNRDNTEMTKSFDALAKSPGVRWQVTINQLKALVIEIGQYAIPALVRLLQPVVNLLHWFNGLSESTKKQIATWAAYGSAVAVVGGTIVIFAGAIGKLLLTLKLLQLESLTNDVGALNIKLAAMIGIVALVVIAFVKFHKQTMDVVDAMGGFKGVLKAILIMMAGFTVVKIASGLASIGGEASTAALMVGRLRLGLLGIVALGAITIPIIENISQSLHHATNATGAGHGNQILAGQQVLKKNSSGLIGWVQSAGQSLNYVVARAAGESAANARAETMWLMGSKYVVPPKDIMKTLSNLALSTTNKAGKPNALGKLITPADQLNLYNLAEKGQISQFEATYNKYMKDAFGRIRKNLSDQAKGIGDTLIKALKRPVVVRAAAIKLQNLMPELKQVAALEAAYEKSPTLQNWKIYFNALKALNTKYSGAMYQGFINDYLNKTTAASKKAAKDIQTAQEKAAKDAQTTLKNAYDNIQSLYTNLLQQNQSNFGQLFSGPFMQSPLEQARLQYNNNTVRPQDVLRDLKSQLSQFNQLNRAVNLTKKRGGPQSLLDQLQALGPGGLPDIRALNKLPKGLFDEYVKTWNRSQKAIKDQTMHQLQGQIQVYKKFGSKVALAIIAGIQSEDPHLQNTLQTMLNKMFPDMVKRAHGPHAPKIVNTGKSTRLAPSTTHHTTHVYSPTIVNPKTESVDTALKKDYHRFKTRKH